MADTIYASFLETVWRHPTRTALLVKRHGKYAAISYAELAAMVNKVAARLQDMKLGKGDAMAILSSNRPEWLITDLAALQLGAVIVPIYPTSTPTTITYIIRDSNAKLLMVEDAKLFNVIASVRDQIGGIKQIIVFDPADLNHETECRPFGELLASANATDGQGNPVSPQDIATIVYTSGTTGEPKGVMLSHLNIVSNVRAMINRYQITQNEVTLSYLPLCHMFERTCGHYTVLFSGGTVAYAESISTVTSDVLQVRPTLFLAVPRILEKAFEQAVDQISRNSRIKQRLVGMTIASLNQRADLRFQRKRIPLSLRVRCAVLDKTIAAQFRKRGGGRLRILASGSAPLDRKIAKAYWDLGFNIVEGYGLTETSPVVCSNSVTESTLGTVGKPVEGVEVRIGQNDEILVRGPNVMRGYLHKPEETAKVIDPDGWLHTGDQGRFDSRGNLVITGRIKDLIVTSYGKKIAATPIEASINRSPYVSQVMLYGDNRKFIVALVVPRRSEIERYATGAGIVGQDYPDLLNTSPVHTLITDEIGKATADLAPHEQVKAAALIPEEFTTDNGLMTVTMKLRRTLIAERYRNLIENLYHTLEGK